MRLTQDTLAQECRAEAYRLVSGNVDTASLRFLGHPFKRNDAWAERGTGATVPVKAGVAVVIPKLPINVQTDQLRRSLRLFMRETGNARTYTLQFMSPHAKYVLAQHGTTRMLPRGFWEALNSFARINQGARYANALRSAERG